MSAPIEDDSSCFCCGKENPRGLRMAFTYPKKGEAEAAFDVPDWFSGWKDVSHGGLLATLLDEIMAHACMGSVDAAVTAEMTVRYKKPVKTGTRVRAVGHLKETRGRLVMTQGWIYNSEGEVAVEATARFMKVAGTGRRGAAPAGSSA